MANLEDILKNFDQRLTAIEARLRQDGPAPVAHSTPPPTPHTGAPAKLYPVDEEITKTYTSPVSQDKISLNSSSALAIIGIIFVILAGVFFIKISIDSGWLTPMRQMLAAACTGLAFFLAPHFFPKAEKEYGSYLAAAGITILHLTWLGAYSYHHLIEANTALVCATIVGIISTFANFEKGNGIYILTSMAGTYLAAPLIGYNVGALPTLSIFLIIWNISFSVSAFINKRREILFIASYYAVFTLLLLSGKADADQHASLLILQGIQFVIFSTALVTYSVYHRDPLSKEASIAILPLLLLFYASTWRMLSVLNPAFAEWFGLVIGVFVLAIYLFAKRLLPNEINSGPVLTSFAAMAVVHSLFFQVVDMGFQPPVGLLIGVLVTLAWVANPDLRKPYFWPAMIFMSTFIFGALESIFIALYPYNLAYGVVALLAVLKLTSDSDTNSRAVELSPLLLIFAHIEVLLGLYRLSQSMESGALFVTGAWGLYAIVILSVAWMRRDQILGKSALTILLAVSLKAFFYDVANTSSIVRVLCLLGEGLLLYCCGWIFKKMRDWKVA